LFGTATEKLYAHSLLQLSVSVNWVNNRTKIHFSINHLAYNLRANIQFVSEVRNIMSGIKSIQIADPNGTTISYSLANKNHEKCQIIMESLDYLLLSGVEGDIEEFGVQRAVFSPVYAFGLNLFEQIYAKMEKVDAQARKKPSI